jgi:hypothetical protein
MLAPDDDPDSIGYAIDLEQPANASNRLIVSLRRQGLIDNEYQQQQVNDTPNRKSEPGRREQRWILC